jgi:hypothetical protein
MKPVSNKEGILLAVLIRKNHRRKSTGGPEFGFEDNIRVGS